METSDSLYHNDTTREVSLSQVR